MTNKNAEKQTEPLKFKAKPDVDLAAGKRIHDVSDNATGSKVWSPFQEENVTNDVRPTNTEKQTSTISNENGAMGYVLAWLLGVPASVLFVIFLLRGH